MRKGSSKVASALQLKLESKIAESKREVDEIISQAAAKQARISALQETLDMLKETGLADGDESEAAA